MVMPGDNIQMGVELITPVAIEEGLRFAIREGGRTVGAGVVTSITEYPSQPVIDFPVPAWSTPEQGMTPLRPENEDRHHGEKRKSRSAGDHA